MPIPDRCLNINIPDSLYINIIRSFNLLSGKAFQLLSQNTFMGCLSYY